MALKYLTQDEAIRIDRELFAACRFSVDQLMELAGLSCAQAIFETYPPGRTLVIAGPGNNGGDGLVCARHLKQFGFNTKVLLPKAPTSDLMNRLVQQCLQMEIPQITAIGSSSENLASEYDLIVDAIFGFSYKPPVREPYLNVLKNIAQTKVPIFSIDIPSGWDVENGPPAIDDPDTPLLSPDALISLTAPKQCARHFSGKHFLGGRFVPPSLAEKYQLNLPKYPGASGFMRID